MQLMLMPGDVCGVPSARRGSTRSAESCVTFRAQVEPEVSAERLAELEAMGFSRNRGVRALHGTGTDSVEQAVNWLVDHGEDADVDTPLLVPKVRRTAFFQYHLAKGEPRGKGMQVKFCDARRSCIATCLRLMFDAHHYAQRRQQPCPRHVAAAACRLCLCPSSPARRLDLHIVRAVCQQPRSRLARRLVLTGGEEAPAQRRGGSPGRGGPAPEGQGEAGGTPTCSALLQ